MYVCVRVFAKTWAFQSISETSNVSYQHTNCKMFRGKVNKISFRVSREIVREIC